MRAGELDHKVTIRRRGAGTEPGVPYSDFTDAFTTRCAIRPAPAKEIAIAGAAVSPIVITLRVYDCEHHRGITAADRATVDGKDYAISAVLPPNRTDKAIDILLTDEPGA